MPRHQKSRPGERLDQHTQNYVEGELRAYRGRQQRIAWLKECHATERLGWDAPPDENAGGGRPAGKVSNPTLARVIAMQHDEELQNLERKVKRVDAGMALLTEAERRIITMVYLERRLTLNGAAIALGYTERHAGRLKNRALHQIAVAMGVVE